VDECFYCGAPLPEGGGDGWSEYCGTRCAEKQMDKDAKEEGPLE